MVRRAVGCGVRLMAGGTKLLMRAPGFAPSDIAGLNLWLDADAITGLADTDPVVTWTDRSAGAYGFTNPNSAQRPVYRTNILNGRSVVRFDGTNDWLYFATTTTGDYTVFAVATKGAASDRSVVTETSNTNFLPIRRKISTDGSGNRRHLYRNNAGVLGNITNGAWATNATKVMVARVSGTGMTLRDGGGATVATATAATGALTSTHTTIGAEMDGLGSLGGAGFWQGDIAEVVAYDSGLSLADIDRVGTYLAAKWGTTWTAAS